MVSFMIYLELEGDKIKERLLMNIGYAMIAVILLDVLINLACYLASVLASLIESIQKYCKKRREKYRIEM